MSLSQAPTCTAISLDSVVYHPLPVQTHTSLQAQGFIISLDNVGKSQQGPGNAPVLKVAVGW